MVFLLPGDDRESKGAHDDPLAIEHLGEELHEGEEEDGGEEENDDEEGGEEMGRKDGEDE